MTKKRKRKKPRAHKDEENGEVGCALRVHIMHDTGAEIDFAVASNILAMRIFMHAYLNFSPQIFL